MKTIKRHPNPHNEFLNFEKPKRRINWEFLIFWTLAFCVVSTFIYFLFF